MEPAFNLIDEPWIPCINNQGSIEELGLRDTLSHAQKLTAIHGESPLVTTAIYRLLLAVIHRAINGPRKRKEWTDIWNAQSLDSTKIISYLDLWHDHFFLFHPEKPFYQAADERMKPKSVISLMPEMASGNNAALFDHHTEEEGVMLTPSEAARALVSAQSFGLAGLCNPKYKLSFTDGPCARGITFMIEGNNLFETLTLNLMRYSEDEPIVNRQDDKPAWEMEDPYTPQREIPRGYLDYLTWQNRRIMLLPIIHSSEITVKEMTISPGLKLDSGVLDPMKHYRKDEKRGELVWRFSENRVLWRDSSTLFELNARDKYRPPVNFQWLGNLIFNLDLDSSLVYRCMALGMANNQAKINFYRHEHLPLPFAYFSNDQFVADLSKTLEWTDSAARLIRNSVGTLALLLISPKSDGKRWNEIDNITKKEITKLREHWGVDRYFWGSLEIPYFNLVEQIPQNAKITLSDWQSILIRCAWTTFNKAEDLAGTSPEALKASVRAGGQLAGGLAKLFPERS